MAELWTSFAGWWARSALAGGLLLLAGLLLMRLVRQPVRRQRVGTWSVAAALLVLPLSLLPGWLALPWPAPPALAERPPTAPTVVTAVPVPRVAEVPDDPYSVSAAPVQEPDGPSPASEVANPTARPAPEPPPAPADWAAVLAWLINGLCVVYAATVVALLARLLAGQLGLFRLWRRSRPAPGPVAGMFASLAARSGRRTELRVSDRVPGPVCFGLWRARVLLPTALVARGDESALRWVLAHELSHAERHDPLGGWLVGLARAFYFYCPWLGALRRDLRLSQEYLADAAAVAGPASRPEEYADFLVRLTGTRPVPLGASGVRAGSSDLFRRVTMLLQSGSIETRCSRRWSLLAAGGMVSAALVLGGLHLRSAEAADQAAPAKADAKNDASKEKLTPEQRRAQLEERLKKLDLNSPEYQETMKEFERLMEAEKAKQPAAPEPEQNPVFPGGLPGGFPADLQKAIEEQNRMVQEQLQRALDLQRDFAGMRLQPFGAARGAGNGRLGVRIERPSPTLAEQLDLPADQGLVIADVRPDSPAAKAGLKVHDVLLELAGKPIPSDAGDFARKIRELKADEAFDLTVLRKGKKEVLKGVKLPEVKAADAGPAFGGPDGLPNALQFQPAEMPFPGRRAFPRFDFNVPRLGMAPGANASSTSVRVVNGVFTIESKQNGITFHITGNKDGDNKEVSEIVVQDGKTEVKAASVDKVPEKYREAVNKLLESIR